MQAGSADLSMRLVAPLLPSFAARPQGGGTAPRDHWAVFTAVVYVLTSGCDWRHLRPAFGTSPATAHRRFTAWTEVGLWRRLHRDPLPQAVPPVLGKRGRPRRRPDVVLGGRGDDHDKYRRLAWSIGVKPRIARRGAQHGSGLGSQRWVVERAFAHLHWFRRLRIHWEIRDDIHEAVRSGRAGQVGCGRPKSRS